MATNKIIGFLHQPLKSGGPGTFQTRLSEILIKDGWQIVYPWDNITPDVILLVVGSKKMFWLFRMKRKGIPIVHRVANINWRHKVEPFEFKKFVMATVRNWLVSFSRRYMANFVIYQSTFAKEFWLKSYGQSKAESKLIHNGTNLSNFKPAWKKNDSCFRIVCVEGNITVDGFIAKMLKFIASQKINGKKTQISIIGKIDRKLEASLRDFTEIEFMGSIPREEVARQIANHDAFLSLEINAACPNSVIEALAAGLPIVAFDTGSMNELVKPDVGILLDYKNDPWKLEDPVIDQDLIIAFEKIDKNIDQYHKAARKVAEEKFDAEHMAAQYLNVINLAMNNN